MRPVQLCVNDSAIVFAAMIAGCAANLPEGSGSTPAAVQAKAVSQSKARDLAFKYRQRASDLREMARHLDMEVQWYSGHFGMTDEQVKLLRRTINSAYRSIAVFLLTPREGQNEGYFSGISPHPSTLPDRERANNTHYLAVGSVSREKAQQLWIAADEADQLAREYRRQVPHGQVS